MWDSDADKYWKEKQKLKRQEELKKKIGAGIVFIIILACIWKVALSPAAVAVTVPLKKNTTVPEVVVPLEVLTSCRNDCRVKAVEHCNNVCRFAHQEMPRPVVFRACQGPCVQIAQSLCDLGTHEKGDIRKNCRASADTLSFQTCRQYENMLPRPRLQQVCKVGASGAQKFVCPTTKQCVIDGIKEMN